jgi:hypothetical protein
MVKFSSPAGTLQLVTNLGNTTDNDIQLDGSSLTSTSGNDIVILPATSSITVIGDAGSTSHTLNTNDDLFVSGKLEVDGNTLLDGALYTYGTILVAENTRLNFGNGTQMEADITHDQFLIGCSASIGMQICIIDYANQTKDFDHATQTNPTLFIHSAADPDTANNQWLSFVHDQTDAEIAVGTGDLYLNPAGVLKFGTHSAIGAETVTGYITIKDSSGNSRKLAVVS